MEVYFTVKDDSESGRRLESYLQSVLEGRKKAEKLARRVGANKRNKFIISTGKICGFSMNEKPDGWASVRDHSGWYFPKRLKANKALLDEINSIELGSPTGISTAIFGESKLYFQGLCLTRGIGYEEIAGRKVISFQDEKHLKLYQGANWPAGLRRVKTSTVIQWQETAAA